MARIEESMIGRVRVIRPVGDFADHRAELALLEHLERYWETPSVCLVVNWQEVTRIKAPALVALRTTEERVTSHGGCVRHCGLGDEHKRLLFYIRLARDLSNVFETEQEAVEGCGGADPSGVS